MHGVEPIGTGVGINVGIKHQNRDVRRLPTVCTFGARSSGRGASLCSSRVCVCWSYAAPVSASDFIRYLSDAIYGLVFVFVAVRAIRRPTRSAIDVAFFFGALTFAVVEGLLSQAFGLAGVPFWTALAGSAVMSLPLWLLRLVDDFIGVPRPIAAATLIGFIASVVVLVAFSPLPPLLTLLLVVYFAAVSLYCAVAFARAARGAQGVIRRRLQSISFGTYLLGLLIVLAGVSSFVPQLSAVLGAAVQLLTLGWALAYAAGFAPPRPLRRLWQEPELRAFLSRATRLPRLPTTAAILQELEAGVAAAFGAGAQIALADAGGTMYFRQAQSSELFPVPVGSTLPARRAYDEQRTLFIEDLMRQDPANASVYRGRVVNSVIIAPITAGDRRLGVLMVHAPRAPLFADDDVTLTALLADQAAVVLESRALIDEATAVRAHEQAALLKDDFLSAAAHDLKTPLTTLVAQSQYLEHRARRDPQAPADPEGLARIAHEAQRMHALVEELLDASRLEQGSFTVHRETVDIVALAREVAARERPAGRPVVLEAGGPIVGLFDGFRIVQLLENVVENALKYCEPDQPVEIRVSQAEDAVHIEVSDTGIGIPPEDLPHVFDRFRRASNVNDRRYAGMGLGLYICRGIVEQHGGAIQIDSQVGCGTTVRISLPLRVADG